MKISLNKVSNGYSEIKKSTQNIELQETDIESKNTKAKIDAYESSAKMAKQAIEFNGATAVVSFRNLQNDAVVQISVTAENIESFKVGYDEKNGAPVTSEISSGLTDKNLEDRGIGADLKISVDEDFNNLLKYDKNIDGVIGKNELAEGMATDMSNLAASGKDVAFLRWLLWLAEGMQDEEKKKKPTECTDGNYRA